MEIIGSNDEKLHTRRMFTVVGLSLLFASSCSRSRIQDAVTNNAGQSKEHQSPVRTKANELLHKFPDSMPYTAKIRKVEIPNAKYCLVIVRQTHGREELLQGGFAAKWIMEQVLTSQRALRNIYLFLREEIGLQSVYTEGVSREHLEFLGTSVLPKMRGMVEELRMQLNKVSGQRRSELEADIKRLEGLLFLLSKQAAFQLNEEGLLELKAVYASDSELADAVRTSQNRAELHDKRKDMALREVVHNGDVFSVMEYGADHQFANNILRWNKEHPEEAFSYIVVTPENEVEE